MLNRCGSIAYGSHISCMCKGGNKVPMKNVLKYPREIRIRIQIYHDLASDPTCLHASCEREIDSWVEQRSWGWPWPQKKKKKIFRKPFMVEFSAILHMTPQPLKNKLLFIIIVFHAMGGWMHTWWMTLMPWLWASSTISFGKSPQKTSKQASFSSKMARMVLVLLNSKSTPAPNAFSVSFLVSRIAFTVTSYPFCVIHVHIKRQWENHPTGHNP